MSEHVINERMKQNMEACEVFEGHMQSKPRLIFEMWSVQCEGHSASDNYCGCCDVCAGSS